MSFREILAETLVRAGANGLKQSEITHKLQRNADSETLADQLHTWWKEGKVDRFTIPPKSKGGRPTKVWRATQIMIDGTND